MSAKGYNNSKAVKPVSDESGREESTELAYSRRFLFSAFPNLSESQLSVLDMYLMTNKVQDFLFKFFRDQTAEPGKKYPENTLQGPEKDAFRKLRGIGLAKYRVDLETVNRKGEKAIGPEDYFWTFTPDKLKLGSDTGFKYVSQVKQLLEELDESQLDMSFSARIAVMKSEILKLSDLTDDQFAKLRDMCLRIYGAAKGGLYIEEKDGRQEGCKIDSTEVMNIFRRGLEDIGIKQSEKKEFVYRPDQLQIEERAMLGISDTAQPAKAQPAIQPTKARPTPKTGVPEPTKLTSEMEQYEKELLESIRKPSPAKVSVPSDARPGERRETIQARKARQRREPSRIERRRVVEHKKEKVVQTGHLQAETARSEVAQIEAEVKPGLAQIKQLPQPKQLQKTKQPPKPMQPSLFEKFFPGLAKSAQSGQDSEWPRFEIPDFKDINIADGQSAERPSVYANISALVSMPMYLCKSYADACCTTVDTFKQLFEQKMRTYVGDSKYLADTVTSPVFYQIAKIFSDQNVGRLKEVSLIERITFLSGKHPTIGSVKKHATPLVKIGLIDKNEEGYALNRRFMEENLFREDGSIGEQGKGERKEQKDG